VRQFEIYWVSLDPTQGSEIKKTRPGVVISPDEMNESLSTVIIAPLTSSKRKYPTRVDVKIQRKNGQVVLDQIRTIDKLRLGKKMGRLNQDTALEVKRVLREMFE
jgi:mRNA interferase MazF